MLKGALRRHPALRTALSMPLALRAAMLARQDRPRQRVADTLQELLADDPVVRVKAFAGVFQISPTSHLFGRLLRFGDYEPELARIFLAHVEPDRDVIDVGANMGFYSVAAAKRLAGGRVLAIEPTEGAHRRLIANLARNGVEERVTVFKGLASDRSGEGQINSIDGREEYASMRAIAHPSVASEASQVFSVPAETIDQLVARFDLRPKLIKVDVEGAEAMVFAGAQETLERHRPVVLSELCDDLLGTFGSSSRDVVEMFRRLDYQVTDPLHPRTAPGTRAMGDILCIPR